MRDGTSIPRLLCATIALWPLWATLDCAAGGAPLQLPPANARVSDDRAPTEAGALGSLLQLQGDPAAVSLKTRRTSVARALAALATTYHVSYRSAIMLDELRDGTYTGSLRYVIARLLDGYNYVIKENNAALDVFVVGKSGAQATPASTMPVVRQHRIPVTYRISRVRR